MRPLGILLSCFAASAVAFAPLAASAQTAPITLEVNTANDLGPVNRDVFGVDFEYISADVPDVATLAQGTPIARFPGGDDTSGFLWTDTTTGTCTEPRWTWPAVATLASQLGMGFMLETNVVRGTADLAAQWVMDARARGLRVAWVGIGNEVWGSWDAGYMSSSQYANLVHQYATSIHAVAPDVKIVLEIGTFNEDTWNRDAVARTADVIDAIDYHYYPNHLSSPDPLSVAAGADGIAPLLARLRQMLVDEAPARASQIQIIFGEWDGASDPPSGGPVPGVAYNQWAVSNALFYGVALGEMLENGVAAAMFYELQGYRFGAVNGNYCSAANYAVYRPKSLVMDLYRSAFGDRLVSTSLQNVPTFTSSGPTNWDGFAGTAPFVRAYASVTNDGQSLRLVVVNRDATNAYPLNLQLDGFTPTASAQSQQIAGASMLSTNENVGGPPNAVQTVSSTVAVPGATFTWSAPAHSVTLLSFTRAAASPPPPPPPPPATDASVDTGTADASVPPPPPPPVDASVDDATVPPSMPDAGVVDASVPPITGVDAGSMDVTTDKDANTIVLTPPTVIGCEDGAANTNCGTGGAPWGSGSPPDTTHVTGSTLSCNAGRTATAPADVLVLLGVATLLARRKRCAACATPKTVA